MDREDKDKAETCHAIGSQPSRGILGSNFTSLHHSNTVKVYYTSAPPLNSMKGATKTSSYVTWVSMAHPVYKFN